MNKHIIAAAAALLAGASAFAQVFTDASAFPLYGKARQDTKELYERLPAEFEGRSRDAVWYLGRNSAGLYVRFSSNSSAIWCRWTAKFGNHMNHQTLVGTRGVDLYTLTDKGEWRFMASGRPVLDSKVTQQRLVGNMEPRMREYMLYLPLYDGVTELAIGVDSTAVLEAPKVDLPRSDKPIVMYGTSILQGGCANRPGMAHTSILSRRFNREVINLGFSGNALLDLEIAELMASVEDPAIYVFDYVPNAYDYLIREKGEQFFRIVRDAHPDVPILFLEDPYFGHYEYDAGTKAEVDKKNAAQRELFNKLKKQGEKNIWYLKSDDMVGHDNEAFVDGIHFTDLGMMRYADWLEPHIRKHMKK
ncbi:MAG: SGNH/GDSL hydrolase family protein [Candidatus Cryptobacteroides sp.]